MRPIVPPTVVASPLKFPLSQLPTTAAVHGNVPAGNTPTTTAATGGGGAGGGATGGGGVAGGGGVWPEVVRWEGVVKERENHPPPHQAREGHLQSVLESPGRVPVATEKNNKQQCS